MESSRKFKIIVNSKECGTCSGSSPSSVAKKVVKKLCGTSSKVVKFSLKECKRGCERVCGPYQGRMEKLERPCKRSGKKITHRVVCGKVRKMRGGRELRIEDFRKKDNDGEFRFDTIGGKPYIFFCSFEYRYNSGYNYVIFNNEIFGNNKTISIMGIRPDPTTENNSRMIGIGPLIIPKNLTLNITSNENKGFSEILIQFLQKLRIYTSFNSILMNFYNELTKLHEELTKEEHSNDYKTIKKYLEILLVGVLPIIIGDEPINNSGSSNKKVFLGYLKNNIQRTGLFKTAESYIELLKKDSHNNFEKIKQHIESLKKGDIMQIFNSFFSNETIQDRIKKNKGYKMPRRGTLEENDPTFKNFMKIQGENIFMYCKNLLLSKLEETKSNNQKPKNNGNGNGNKNNNNNNNGNGKGKGNGNGNNNNNNE